jgi:hypothetical protein
MKIRRAVSTSAAAISPTQMALVLVRRTRPWPSIPGGGVGCCGTDGRTCSLRTSAGYAAGSFGGRLLVVVDISRRIRHPRSLSSSAWIDWSRESASEMLFLLNTSTGQRYTSCVAWTSSNRTTAGRRGRRRGLGRGLAIPFRGSRNQTDQSESVPRQANPVVATVEAPAIHRAQGRRATLTISRVEVCGRSTLG